MHGLLAAWLSLGEYIQWTENEFGYKWYKKVYQITKKAVSAKMWSWSYSTEIIIYCSFPIHDGRIDFPFYDVLATFYRECKYTNLRKN